MRYLVALLLIFAASCSPRDDNAVNHAADNEVDIGIAAKEAQGSIDAYANSTRDNAPATPISEPARDAVSTPAPLTAPAATEAAP